MFALALGAFVLMFAFGADFMGRKANSSHLQQAMLAAFILGVFGGYRAKAEAQ